MLDTERDVYGSHQTQRSELKAKYEEEKSRVEALAKRYHDHFPFHGNACGQNHGAGAEAAAGTERGTTAASSDKEGRKWGGPGGGMMTFLRAF
eukprot:1545930-Rhodomonas_salina.2